jgi:hypothetical protein
MSIVITEQKTWPSEIVSYLDDNYQAFLGWETSGQERASESEHEQAVQEFREILNTCSVIGYHCTKLTSHEIEDIALNGMKLQNSESLKARVLKLNSLGEVNDEIAMKFIASNRSGARNRASKLWFCFFEPHLDGFDGIHRFFKYWGGEALYLDHVASKDSADTLKRLGTPCIIKAHVNINSLEESYYPDKELIRVYLLSKGYDAKKDIEPEGFSIENVSSMQIDAIYEYPTAEFVRLTRCNEWGDESVL